jgi:uncharacterized membrane protein
MVTKASGPPVTEPSEPAAETVDSGPGEGGRGQRDLVLTGLVAVLGLILTEAPTLVRALLGPAAVLFAPGYAAISALFPSDDQLDWIERLGISLSTSFAMIAMLGLALASVPNGLTFNTIRLSVTGGTLLLLVVAAVRRARARGAVRTEVAGATESPRGRPGRAVRFTQAIVAANVAVAALAYVVTIGASAPASTALYVLGPDGRHSEYQNETIAGDSVAVSVGVRQADGVPGRYVLSARSGDTLLAAPIPVVVDPGGTWQSQVRLSFPRAGPDQELALTLERDGDERPLRVTRLWFNVLER